MSVIVLGMEMPEHCGKCDFEPCMKWKNREPMTRPDDCPLRPLPEKHGRLIDADNFELYVQYEWEKNEASNGDWISFREWLKDQSTIVEAEGD